jgi:NADPH:quinone reductase-like Zn-dependent oxidoreductase
MPTLDELRARGELGGRTVVITDRGSVECVELELATLPPGSVRVRTVTSALSPGTEMTFVGSGATNAHLVKRWNEELRVFEAGPSHVSFPMPFGYRAAGEVVETSALDLPIGTRVWGNWRHTEFVTMGSEQAFAQQVPGALSWDDAVDIGQMGPICANAAAFGAADVVGHPAVVFGAGPIGLITAQMVRELGPSSVVVVDRLRQRLEIAEQLGLEGLEVGGDVDAAVALKRRWGADAIPVVWECTGAVPALHEAIRCLARRGTVVAVGFYQGGAQALRLGEEFHHNGIRIVTAQIGNPYAALTRRDLQVRTLQLVRSGQVVLGGLPRIRVPVEGAADGFDALRRPAEVLQVSLDYVVAREGEEAPASSESSQRFAGRPPP